MVGSISGDDKMLKAMGVEFEELITRMGFRGHEIIAQRVAQYGIECDLKYGYMDAAFNQSQLDGFERYFQLLDKYGLADQCEMISAVDMPSVLATNAYIGGMINRRNGHLHPLNLCIGEAKAAAERGVKIFENTQVLSIKREGKARIISSAGVVLADSVVLAGNAYQYLPERKLAGKLFPASSYLIATEPLSQQQADALNPQDLAVCDANVILDYHRLSADKRLLFGGLCNYSGRQPASIKAVLQPRLAGLFPQLKDKHIDFEWGGDIGIVINRVPMLGRLDNNVFYALGYCGHGVSTSHLAGEIMAEAIAGTFERLDVFEKVGHYRMPFGQYVGQQLLALGMLYFRIKDKLK
jgi:glycine/D-amino acid oxidase-like deaminating enzyme